MRFLRPRSFAATRSVSRFGFTLVELLVVIGIIGVLIALLVGAVNRVRGQARTAVCSSQLRQHMLGLLSYAAENRGSMPYAFAWYQMNTTTAPGAPVWSGHRYFAGPHLLAPAYHWWVILQSQYARDGNAGLYPEIATKLLPSLSAPDIAVRLNASFRCPELDSDPSMGQVRNVYVGNPVVTVNQSFEVAPSQPSWWRYPSTSAYDTTFYDRTGTRSAIPPAKLSQLYPDNAVLWEAPALSYRDGTLSISNLWGGFTMSGVDDGRMAWPANGWKRYREAPQPLPGARVSVLDDPSKPIFIPGRNVTVLGVSSGRFANSDAPFSDFTYPYQYGTPRFRHNGNRGCNVAFADGSVRTLQLSPNRIAYTDDRGRESIDNEFLRRYLLIRRPSSLPSPQYR
jgi:prepilin-type N-terminal cleavage/methylation domain-containing protein/prepilin-type processing-associated H-X9-DG protein